MKIYKILLAIFFVLKGFSQDYKGVIKEVKENGLHKIEILQEVRSASEENFNFLRIKSDENEEVPYVLVYNTDRKFSRFTPITIVSKKRIKDSITSIVLENKLGKKQNHVILKITNTSITKRYTISGSNDQSNWFGLVANRSLKNINDPKKAEVEKTINFPLTTYKFIKINIDDSYSLPVEVLDAGIYKSEVFTQSPIEINSYKYVIKQDKENKKTIIKFTAKSASKIDYISFNIDTQFYLRKAKFFVEKTRKIKKREEAYNQYINEIQLNSKNNTTFTFNNLNEKEFSIEIENKDNPALNISDIELFQNPVYLITDLKKEEEYNIEIDKKLSRPYYDLGNFISNKTEGIKTAVVSDFFKLEKKQSINKEKSFWQTSTFMWICIVFGGVLVVYFALSLLKDIGKENSK